MRNRITISIVPFLIACAAALHAQETGTPFYQSKSGERVLDPVVGGPRDRLLEPLRGAGGTGKNTYCARKPGTAPGT